MWNAIRCVGKFLRDNNLVNKDVMTIETLSGIKTLQLLYHNKEVQYVKVDMGKAELNPKLIPVNLDGDKVVNKKVEIAGQDYDITCVSMGNPHCVVFQNNIDNFDIETLGHNLNTHHYSLNV